METIHEIKRPPCPECGNKKTLPCSLMDAFWCIGCNVYFFDKPITEAEIIRKITPTQRQIVLEYLNKAGCISKDFALKAHGIKNLNEIIRRIRKMGINIETISQEKDVVYKLKQIC